METAYPFYLLKKMAGLHLGEVLASMAGISVSRTPYKLFHDYFWLQPLNRAFTCNVKHRLPTEGFRSPAYHWLSRRVFWLHIQWSWSQDLEFWFDFQYGVIRGLWPPPGRTLHRLSIYVMIGSQSQPLFLRSYTHIQHTEYKALKGPEWWYGDVIIIISVWKGLVRHTVCTTYGIIESAYMYYRSQLNLGRPWGSNKQPDFSLFRMSNAVYIFMTCTG